MNKFRLKNNRVEFIIIRNLNYNYFSDFNLNHFKIKDKISTYLSLKDDDIIYSIQFGNFAIIST